MQVTLVFHAILAALAPAQHVVLDTIAAKRDLVTRPGSFAFANSLQTSPQDQGAMGRGETCPRGRCAPGDRGPRRLRDRCDVLDRFAKQLRVRLVAALGAFAAQATSARMH